MMTNYALGECWDRLADIPAASERLRQFIFEIAVRGRLARQEDGDEPAHELLKRIAIEKQRLLDSGELRKPREFETSVPLEQPYPIPKSWCWVRLDAIGAVIGGGTPSSDDPRNFTTPGSGVPWLTPADLGGRRELRIGRGARDLTDIGLEQSSATLMPAGTVLFTSRAPIGYVALAANPISTNQGFKSIVPYVMECSRFIALVMKAFAPAINAKAPATTFKEVSGKLVAAIPFPLPPLEEQKRIVALVDQLTALCDGLEEVRKRRETVRDALARSTFSRLAQPSDEAESFRSDVECTLATLGATLFRPGQTRLLRQAVLNLAVRGKLVRQAPGDESALSALARIASERADLITRGVLRRERPLRTIHGEEPPYALPEGWAWERIGNTVLFTQYGTSEKAERFPTGVPVLAMGNIQDGAVRWHNEEKKLPAESSDLPALFLKQFDLLYNRTNSAELVGKTGIYLGEDDVHTFASYLIRLRPSLKSSDPRYLNLAMNAPVFRETQVVPLIKKQTGQANVNGTALKNMLIPVPPLKEQRRIVAKVDELMTLCDALEQQLARVQKEQRRFLEAVLSDTLRRVERSNTEPTAVLPSLAG